VNGAVGGAKHDGIGEAGNKGPGGSDRMLEDIEGIGRHGEHMAGIDEECGSRSMVDPQIE
jgi:hypothetical protein